MSSNKKSNQDKKTPKKIMKTNISDESEYFINDLKIGSGDKLDSFSVKSEDGDVATINLPFSGGGGIADLLSNPPLDIKIDSGDWATFPSNTFSTKRNRADNLIISTSSFNEDDNIEVEFDEREVQSIKSALSESIVMAGGDPNDTKDIIWRKVAQDVGVYYDSLKKFYNDDVKFNKQKKVISKLIKSYRSISFENKDRVIDNLKLINILDNKNFKFKLIDIHYPKYEPIADHSGSLKNGIQFIEKIWNEFKTHFNDPKTSTSIIEHIEFIEDLQNKYNDQFNSLLKDATIYSKPIPKYILNKIDLSDQGTQLDKDTDEIIFFYIVSGIREFIVKTQADEKKLLHDYRLDVIPDFAYISK